MKHTTLRFVFIIILLVSSFSCSKEDQFNKEETRLLDSIQKYTNNNPDKVIPFLHQFLKKTKREKYRRYMYAALASNYKIKNNTDSTLYYLHKGLGTCKESRDIINYKYEIGVFYEERYNYDDATLMYKQCYDLAKKEKSLEELQKIEHSLKLLKNKVLESDEALLFLEENYNKEKDKVTEITDKNIRYIRKDLIEALVYRKRTNKALLLIEEGLEQANKRNNKEFLFYLFKLKAEAYLEIKETELAFNAINRAIAYSKEFQNQNFINEANYVLARVRVKLNEPEKAITLIKTIIDTKKERPIEQSSNYDELLAVCYEQIGSTSLSLEHYKKHKKHKEIVTRKRITLINNIDRIGLDEEILERKKQETKTMYWNIAFVILFIFGLLFFFRNRKNQKENQQKFNNLMLKIETFKEEKLILKDNIESNETNTNNIEEKSINLIEKANTEHSIKDEKVKEILVKMTILENKKYFLRQDCTLHNMAKRLKTNTSYLSKIFNTHLNKTFNTYINELRINYVIVELKNNKKLRAYSTKAISEDLGYKTVDSFTKYFKQTTGITPSVYIKKLKKQNKHITT